MAPDDFDRRVDSATAKDAGWVHFDNLFPSECQDMSIHKENVSSTIVPPWKFARIGFRLPCVKRLKRAEPRLTGQSVI